MSESVRLVPISNEDGKLRTPVWVRPLEYDYAVCVAEHKYRFYSEETLPTQIKSLLGMVLAFPADVRTVKSLGLTSMQIYVPPDPRLKDIGWQVTESIFILVIDPELLEEMWPRHQKGK